MTKQRYYYMDSMRSILMCLIVFFHAGNIYMIDGDWVVSDSSQSIVFNIINPLLHTFRLPSFYAISGFFCLFSLLKYGPSKFLQIRLIRILVPLLCTSVSLNTIQFWFLYRYVNNNSISLLSFIIAKLKYIWLNNTWASHLWFLVNLTVYFILSASAYFITCHVKGKYKIHCGLCGIILAIIRHRYCFLFILPLVSISFFAIASLWPPFLYGSLFHVIDMYPLLRFMPFFLFGIWLYGDPIIQREFLRGHLLEIPLFAVCLWATYVTSMDGTLAEKCVNVYCSVLSSWISSSWCFILFHKYFNKKSHIFQYLSDASYSIYLFHHIIVIATGFFIIRYNIPVLLKWSLVILVTGTVSVSIHHFLILRINLLRLMFNGKLNK